MGNRKATITIKTPDCVTAGEPCCEVYRWLADEYRKMRATCEEQHKQLCELIYAGNALNRIVRDAPAAPPPSEYDNACSAWEAAVDAAIPEHAKPTACKLAQSSEGSS